MFIYNLCLYKNKSCVVLNKHKSSYFCASSLSTCNFSARYGNLQHRLIKDKQLDLVERTFLREYVFYLTCNEKHIFYCCCYFVVVVVVLWFSLLLLLLLLLLFVVFLFFCFFVFYCFFYVVVVVVACFMVNSFVIVSFHF